MEFHSLLSSLSAHSDLDSQEEPPAFESFLPQFFSPFRLESTPEESVIFPLLVEPRAAPALVLFQILSRRTLSSRRSSH